MKNHQENASALPALLRTDNGGATLETNSLCCAAAGITAPTSTTAEALAPHEKLRGAALADTTLKAQKCALAQLAFGEKALLRFDGQLHHCQLASRDRNRLRVMREDSGTPHPVFIRAIREQTSKDYALLKSASNNQKGFDHFWERQVHWIDPFQSHQLCFDYSYNLRFEGYVSRLNISKAVEEKAAYGCRAIRHATNELKNHLVALMPSSHCISSLLVADVKGCAYSRNTSKRLEPGSSISLQIKRIKHYKQRPAQSADRKKKPNHPHTCDFQKLQNSKPHDCQRPIATNFSTSLNCFEFSVHGGAI
jgi:hypothetical protein